jgi:hypothetical protein
MTDEFDLDPVVWREETGDRLERAIEAVGAPVFGMTTKWDCHRSITGWGSGSLSLSHRTAKAWIEVVTSIDQHAWDAQMLERHALHRWFLSRVDSIDLEFPLQVVAHRWDAAVEIDEAPYVFSFVGDELTWVAWGEHEARHISVDGRGLHPGLVVLATVDPGSYEDPASFAT